VWGANETLVRRCLRKLARRASHSRTRGSLSFLTLLARARWRAYQLAELGVGVGLYFRLLRVLSRTVLAVAPL
jgi:hypothetical protein